MRLFSIALLIAALVPLAAQAQSIKQVEVINLPAVQDVTGTVEVTNDAANPVEVLGEIEVTNLPAVQDVNVVGGAPDSCEARRIQLVGFTSTLYTGNLGGSLGSTAKCQIDFPDSRMCTQEEIQKTTKLPASIADFAWMEPLSPSCQASLIIDGQEVANLRWSCNDSDAPCRMSAGQDLGSSFETTGSSTSLRLPCSVEQPIACCALVP